METRFVEPEGSYELALPGYFLKAEGVSETNEGEETTYQQYGLVLEHGDHVQQLYSDLAFSSKTPFIIWSGDLNGDGIPDLLFESSINPDDIDAHYQLWLSDPQENVLNLVAEHKVYIGG